MSPTKAQSRFDDRSGHIYFDGKIVPWRKANVHVLTNALHYAGSVFEGERAYGGVIFRSEDHSARLLRSAAAIYIPVDLTVSQIEAAKTAVLEANGLKDAYVRAVVWRGAGKMGVDPSGTGTHFAVAPWTDWTTYFDSKKLETGLSLSTVPTRRPPPNTMPVLHKVSGNYTMAQMAKTEASLRGADEALMLDWEGYVAESSATNIFFVKDGALFTPLADRFLPGLTREAVIAGALEEGYTVEYSRRITPEELMQADEVFLTGTAAEISPVGNIDGREFSVKGPVTGKLREMYNDIVRSDPRAVTDLVSRFASANGTPPSGGTVTNTLEPRPA